MEDPKRPAPWNGGSNAYPAVMRDAPRGDWPWAVEGRIWPGPMPERVSWTAGVLLPANDVPVHVDPGDRPDWWHKFCGGKHGPCELY